MLCNGLFIEVIFCIRTGKRRSKVMGNFTQRKSNIKRFVDIENFKYMFIVVDFISLVTAHFIEIPANLADLAHLVRRKH